MGVDRVISVLNLLNMKVKKISIKDKKIYLNGEIMKVFQKQVSRKRLLLPNITNGSIIY